MQVMRWYASLLLLLGTPEENTQYMLVSMGVMRISKSGSLRFLTNKMEDLIGEFQLMDSCEVTKHRVIGYKSPIFFLCLGTNIFNLMNKPGVVKASLPKYIFEVNMSFCNQVNGFFVNMNNKSSQDMRLSIMINVNCSLRPF